MTLNPSVAPHKRSRVRFSPIGASALTSTLSLFDPHAILVRPLCHVAPTPRLVWVLPTREVGSDPRAELGPTHEQSWVRPTDGVGSDPRTRLGRTQHRAWVGPRIALLAPHITPAVNGFYTFPFSAERTSVLQNQRRRAVTVLFLSKLHSDMVRKLSINLN